MKLLYILPAILALTFAIEIKDSQAEASNFDSWKEGTKLPEAPLPYRYTVTTQKPLLWHHHTTTPIPTTTVAGYNHETYWNKGNYRYEYLTPDGTHVAEEGYFKDKNRTPESLVKEGWYSFIDANGVRNIYRYYADHTGYHAYPVHQPTYHGPQTTTPAPHVHDVPYQPSYDQPQQPSYNQPQQPSYNQPQQPSYNRPQQPAYDQPQQPSYNHPQQPSYNQPQQPSYNRPQQPAYDQPQQPSYNHPQQPSYNPNYWN